MTASEKHDLHLSSDRPFTPLGTPQEERQGMSVQWRVASVLGASFVAVKDWTHPKCHQRSDGRTSCGPSAQPIMTQPDKLHKRMNPRTVILNEIRQTKQYVSHNFCKILENANHSPLAECRSMVAWGWDAGRATGGGGWVPSLRGGLQANRVQHSPNCIF